MMRQRLQQRLQQLEVAHARTRQKAEAIDNEASGERVRHRLKLFFYIRGVEPEGNESVMETWARALGVTLRDLRGMLLAGVDPICKYFTDTGLYDEIERRKAAGTWPSGSEEGRANVSA